MALWSLFALQISKNRLIQALTENAAENAAIAVAFISACWIAFKIISITLKRKYKSLAKVCVADKNASFGCGSTTDGCCMNSPAENFGCCAKNSSSFVSKAPFEIKIFYATQTDTARKFAMSLKAHILTSQKGIFAPENISLLSIAEYDNENFYTETAFCIFLLATYTGGSPTEDAVWFMEWLEDAYFDFRVSRDALSKLSYAVVGLGHSDYAENYNKVAKVVNYRFCKMGAFKCMPLCELDAKFDQEEQFGEFCRNLEKVFAVLCSVSSSKWRSTLKIDESVELIDSDDEVSHERDDVQTKANYSEEENVDVEDLGLYVKKISTAKTERVSEESNFASFKTQPKNHIGEEKSKIVPRDMVTPMLHKALTKQGYKIIGSHSGVKICRWTKAMLRGRGGCYKHTFYGIASHLCMETTPSLACANKCVFCWRHHTNPVGTEWRWNMDDPQLIVDGALENHYRMIKQLKGVPGVDAARFKEAMRVRHCALSLVGEPIMYPKINDFVKILHEKEISTFLVTNAQFPDRIDQLSPVTQLYVSVDASTKESLKKIDRPLFKDFWERFLACLESLHRKKQRTVYRLTLVRDYNVDELASYVELIKRGMPDFIEVKGVTFCGYSGANPLTMANVPYHWEVAEFCRKLLRDAGSALKDYELACEHEHSCSVLIAHKKFLINGKWHTWIDYSKFHKLVKSNIPFSSLDYCAQTPDWAVTGSDHKGFDPEETRFFRKKNTDSLTGQDFEVPVDQGC